MGNESGAVNSFVPELKQHSSRLSRFPSGPLYQKIEELDDVAGRDERVLHLTAARVVFADTELLQHDFPELTDAAILRESPRLWEADEGVRRTRVRHIIEQWLLRQAAVISVAQTQQCQVNTPVPAEESETAYRPTRYGRGLVVRTRATNEKAPERGAGLLEVKGTGVAPGEVPTRELHRSGLMQLGEALQDAVLQWVIEAIFWHANTYFSAVPLYAVLDAGFDAYTGDGRTVPAGLQVRRAHRRPLFANELPDPGSLVEELKGEVEMLLRRYGITSCKDGTLLELAQDKGCLKLRYAGRSTWLPDDSTRAILRMLAGVSLDWTGQTSLEGINVQFAREVGSGPSRAQVVDFGQYTFRDHFRFPALNLVRNRPLMWGSALHPESPHYLQPNPDLSIPSQNWHGAKSWNLAAAYRNGELTGDEVLSEIFSFLQQVAKKWRLPSGTCASVSGDRIDPAGLAAAEQAHLAGSYFSSESRRLQTLIDGIKVRLSYSGRVSPEQIF
jgi:hypothetical protein